MEIFFFFKSELRQVGEACACFSLLSSSWISSLLHVCAYTHGLPVADPNKERPLDHLWLWFCFSVDNRLFFHVSQIFWLLNILCRTVETEVPSIYAWECTCLFLSQCSISPVRSWARFWFCCCYGYHQLHISVLYVVLRVGAGLLRRFFSAFLFYALFSALSVQLCLRGGSLCILFPLPWYRLLLLISAC